jgi:uncharacterized SAM-binding protein YcdF (DUF218 family)
MFLFKKIVGPFFFPLTICLELLVGGLILLWCTRKQRAGRILVTMGTGILVLLSYSVGSEALLEHLERQYPALLNPTAIASAAAEKKPIKWIVVLGGGAVSDPQLPVTSRISGASLYRIVEAVRLHRQIPGSKLVLSGGGVWGNEPEAEVMARVALIMGVKAQDLVLEATSKDTEEQARNLRAMVGEDKFILVTSASHIPRSMAFFKKRGMNPIPAPAGYQVQHGEGIVPRSFFPDPGGLQQAETAFYEYMGLAWAWLRGAI